MRRRWRRSTTSGASGAAPRPESSRSPAPKSMAKIAMNLPSASTAVASQIHPFGPWRSPDTAGFTRAATTIANDCMCTGRIPSTPTPRSASSEVMRGEASGTAKAGGCRVGGGRLRGGGRDDRLRAATRGGVGEGLFDALERELRADEPLHPELRQEGEGAAEGGTAPVGAVDADLAEVHVEEIDRHPAALRVDPDQLEHSGRPHHREGLGDQLGLAHRL